MTNLCRLLPFALLVIALAFMPAAWAQEATEEAAPTSTEAPTLTATDLPTAIPTETETPTTPPIETAIPTSTAEPEVTPEVTVWPTEAPVIPTEAPTEAPTQITVTVEMARAQVMLENPPNRAVINQAQPELRWQPDPAAAGYQVQLDNNGNFSSPVFDVIVPAGNSAVPAEPLADGRYFWRVRSLDAENNPDQWSRRFRFTVDTEAPGYPVLRAPRDGATTRDSTPRLTWRKVRGASAYRVDVATDAAFSNLVVNSAEVKPSNFTPLSSLAQGMYYWRVQAGDAAGNWSGWPPEYRSFVIALQRAPADGHTFTNGNAKPTRFTWQRMPGALNYQLQVAADSAFNTLVHTSPALTATNYRLPAALDNGIYYWRVNVDMGGGLLLSPVGWRFTVSPPPPGRTALQSPANNITTNNPAPLLAWNAAAGATSYEVMLDNNGNFQSPEFTAITNDTTAQVNPALAADGRYYWRVRALNEWGVGGRWSKRYRYTLDTTPPAVPELRSPANGAAVLNTRIPFKWKPNSDAAFFDFQLSTNGAFDSSALSVMLSSAKYKPVSSLLYTTYSWRVQAVDAAGNRSAWSEVWQLQVQSAEGAAPLPHRYTTATPVLTWAPFTWATAFEVQVDDHANFSSPVYSDNGLAGGATSVTLPPLTNGTWHWRVRARHSSGVWTGWSSHVFTVEVS